MNKRFLTATDIANEFGITEATLSRWVAAREFPKPLRFNLRKKLWLRCEVESHIEKLSQARQQQN